MVQGSGFWLWGVPSGSTRRGCSVAESLLMLERRSERFKDSFLGRIDLENVWQSLFTAVERIWHIELDSGSGLQVNVRKMFADAHGSRRSMLHLIASLVAFSTGNSCICQPELHISPPMAMAAHGVVD